MLVCVAIFCTLGFWQVKRLHWKENLIAKIDQAYQVDAANNPVTESQIVSLGKDSFIRGSFKGRFDFGEAFKLMGQIDDGKQTSHLMLPLVVSQDLTILVDLGPDLKLPQHNTGEGVITGLLKNAPEPNRFTPDNHPHQEIWYSINTDQLQIKNLKPFVILPETTPWQNYEAHKPELRNSHLQYAIFWFTMAALIAGLTAFYLHKKTP